MPLQAWHISSCFAPLIITEIVFRPKQNGHVTIAIESFLLGQCKYGFDTVPIALLNTKGNLDAIC